MKKLEISPAFTLEDIRKIRDYNYEMTKDMTEKDRDAYYDKILGEAMNWYNDFLAKRNINQNIAAEPQEEYQVKKTL